MNYHDRVKQCREHFHLTQSEMADRLGISLRSYQNYERGEREITVALVRAFYEDFRVAPVWTLTGEGPMLLTEKRNEDQLQRIQEYFRWIVDTVAEVARNEDATRKSSRNVRIKPQQIDRQKSSRTRTHKR